MGIGMDTLRVSQKLYFGGANFAIAVVALISTPFSEASPSKEPTVFTLNAVAPTAPKDIGVQQALLELALKKTQPTHGKYRIQYSPQMNLGRALKELEKNTYPNLLILTTFNRALQHRGLEYIHFPLDLGMTGYRVCFSRPETEQNLKHNLSLQSLQALKIGQGTEWADSSILERNQFTVVKVPEAKHLLRMVAFRRIDLVCRGANELKPEYLEEANSLGLQLASGFALHYALPRFFLMNQNSKHAMQRIEKGLHLAQADGSLLALQRQLYGPSIREAQLHSKKIFELKNPEAANWTTHFQEVTDRSIWWNW
jgi:hypothetical protein